MIPLFQGAMNRTVVRVGMVLVILLPLGILQGCFGLPRAADCNNPGVFGCKDKGPQPSEITLPPADRERAPPGGTVQPLPVGDGSHLEGQEYPWSRPLNDCMAAGGTRTECFASLPPDILAQFEAWEAERAAERRRQLQKGSPRPSFGVESAEANDRAEMECSPEERDVGACIEIYQPVCATVNVLCIATPCDPVQETFANSCKACMNSLVSAYTEGACPVDPQGNAQVGYGP